MGAERRFSVGMGAARTWLAEGPRRDSGRAFADSRVEGLALPGNPRMDQLGHANSCGVSWLTRGAYAAGAVADRVARVAGVPRRHGRTAGDWLVGGG